MALVWISGLEHHWKQFFTLPKNSPTHWPTVKNWKDVVCERESMATIYKISPSFTGAPSASSTGNWPTEYSEWRLGELCSSRKASGSTGPSRQSLRPQAVFHAHRNRRHGWGVPPSLSGKCRPYTQLEQGLRSMVTVLTANLWATKSQLGPVTSPAKADVQLGPKRAVLKKWPYVPPWASHWINYGVTHSTWK